MDPLKPIDHAEAMALFRSEVVGALVRRELAHGELRAALRALSATRFRPPDSTRTRTFSVPTLERWLYAYRRGGLAALRPQPRSDRGRARELTPEQRALLLDIRREHPSASVALILRTLVRGPNHGYGIAQHIQMLSADVLTIEEGSLYPALQRMLVKGWVLAEWKISANNRRARFYTLTTAGKKQLGVEESRFSQMFGAIMRVMKTT